MQIIPKVIPNDNVSWSGGFPYAKYLKGFSWFDNINVFYSWTPTNQFNVWLNTRRNVATSILYFPDPDSYYVTYVSNLQSPCLLTEDCVPLVCDDGTYIIVS